MKRGFEVADLDGDAGLVLDGEPESFDFRFFDCRFSSVG